MVAECGRKIVGQAAVIPSGRDTAELCIFVHRNYQNRGIGQQMLRLIVDYCRRAGYRGIYLTTERSNVRAIHVFRKVGFRIVDSCYDYEMFLPLTDFCETQPAKDDQVS
nr:GNAT family N-acetyltransferase [Archaeoglobus veneficus]